MADVNKARETVIPPWPERFRAQKTFSVEADANKHFPPIKDEKAQTQAVARLGRKEKS